MRRAREWLPVTILLLAVALAATSGLSGAMADSGGQTITATQIIVVRSGNATATAYVGVCLKTTTLTTNVTERVTEYSAQQTIFVAQTSSTVTAPSTSYVTKTDTIPTCYQYVLHVVATATTTMAFIKYNPAPNATTSTTCVAADCTTIVTTATEPEQPPPSSANAYLTVALLAATMLIVFALYRISASRRRLAEASTVPPASKNA